MEVLLKTVHPLGRPTSRFLLQASLRKSTSCFNFHSIPSPYLGFLKKAVTSAKARIRGTCPHDRWKLQTPADCHPHRTIVFRIAIQGVPPRYSVVPHHPGSPAPLQCSARLSSALARAAQADRTGNLSSASLPPLR